MVQVSNGGTGAGDVTTHQEDGWFHQGQSRFCMKMQNSRHLCLPPSKVKMMREVVSGRPLFLEMGLGPMDGGGDHPEDILVGGKESRGRAACRAAGDGGVQGKKVLSGKRDA